MRSVSVVIRKHNYQPVAQGRTADLYATYLHAVDAHQRRHRFCSFRQSNDHVPIDRQDRRVNQDEIIIVDGRRMALKDVVQAQPGDAGIGRGRSKS
jgi:hypothetical protein